MGAVVAGEILARLFVPAPLDSSEPQVRIQLDKPFRWAFAPEQDAYTLSAPVHINAIGTRGNAPETPKPAGRQRLVGLGDSFAFGIGVDDDQTFYSQLGRLLSTGGEASREVDVVNASVPGYWTGQEVDWLEQRGLALEPDLVILQFYFNDLPRVGDWDDSDTESYEAFLRDDRAGVRGRRPKREGMPAAPAPATGDPWYKAVLRQSQLLFVLRYRCGGWVRQVSPDRIERWANAVLEGESSPRLDLAWGAIETQLARAKSLLDPVGVRLLVVVIPMPQQFMGNFPRASYQERVLAMGQRVGVEVLDVEPEIRAHADGWRDLFIPYEWHLNERGHELVAEELRRVIQAKDLLPRR